MNEIEKTLQEFSLYITVEKGLARNSIEAYLRDIRSFCRYLQEETIDSFSKVSQQKVIDYFMQKKREEYASSSRFRFFISLKVFFRFLFYEGLISYNPIYHLEHPKISQLLPEVLSVDEVKKLLEQPDQTTCMGARDRAMLEVLYGSGLRVSELVHIRLQDVDQNFLRVRGKGNKERMVPMGSKATEAVDHYLIHHRQKYAERRESFLFLSKRGKKLHRITVWKQIKKYTFSAGIKKNIFPHTFRHTFATHILDRGADLRVIQELLGHASIHSTNRYTHLSRKKLQDDFQNFHSRYE